MKIISDTTGGTKTHIRDIKIEDGPVVDAGSNYAMTEAWRAWLVELLGDLLRSKEKES